MPTDYTDVLWVRHCESCSNIAPTTVEKYSIPPVCTWRGIREALVLAFHVMEMVESSGVSWQNVDFYCSYLPRAMITACLVAGMFVKISAPPMQNDAAALPILHVRVLCHIGEFENPEEVATQAHTSEQGCVSAPTESIATKKNARCWANALNETFSHMSWPARIQLESIDCAPRKTRCTADMSKGWMADLKGAGDRDYKSFESHVVDEWLKEKRTKNIPQQFHAVVSHGSYVRAALFPDPAQQLKNRGKMKNTAMVFQRYYVDSDDLPTEETVHADKPLEYSFDEKEYPLSGVQTAEVNRQFQELQSQWGPSDVCDWRGSELPWSHCLSASRENVLNQHLNMIQSKLER
uniref:Uncharacterized protein n=1 Tax=viral metagenome TaxID=1070528 RepID=A0A6C0C1K5_9ZZZZ